MREQSASTREQSEGSETSTEDLALPSDETRAAVPSPSEGEQISGVVFFGGFLDLGVALDLCRVCIGNAPFSRVSLFWHISSMIFIQFRAG